MLLGLILILTVLVISTILPAAETSTTLPVPHVQGLSKEAISLLFKYLPRAYKDGPQDFEAREKVHSAATIAGMAFANAFLGICHSMAHKLVGGWVDNAHAIKHICWVVSTLRDRPVSHR
jgi:acetaldehyde dehydrogenase/alcohol dehydrogenase